MAKILLGANHYAVAGGRYMMDAFRRIGTDVRTFGPPMGNQIWGMTVEERHIWKPDASPGIPSRFDCNVKEALDAFPGWTPDLILIVDSAFDLIGRREDFPCPKVLYGVDNHVRSYSERNQWFDHKFLAHHDGPTLPVDDSKDNTWLPCAYDPEWFTPSPIPMAERKYDVMLVGYPYPDRVVILEAMQAAGIAAYGTLGALYEDYRNLYHHAKISLCVSAAKDVAQRIFETAAMGCAILTDRCIDLPHLGLREYQHYAPYNTVNEAVIEAKRLLGYLPELERMAQAGQAWTAPHTWDARAKTILEKMELT